MYVHVSGTIHAYVREGAHWQKKKVVSGHQRTYTAHTPGVADTKVHNLGMVL